MFGVQTMMFGVIEGACLEHEGTGLDNADLDGDSISNQRP